MSKHKKVIEDGKGPTIPPLPSDAVIEGQSFPSGGRRKAQTAAAEALKSKAEAAIQGASFKGTAEEKEKAIGICKTIIDQLSPKDVRKFVTYTLKEVITRSEHNLRNETFENLSKLQSCRALSTSFPVLLKAFPRITFARLSISEYLHNLSECIEKDSQAEFFDTLFPSLLGDTKNTDAQYLIRTLNDFLKKTESKPLHILKTFLPEFETSFLAQLPSVKRVEFLDSFCTRTAGKPDVALKFFFETASRLKKGNPETLKGSVLDNWEYWGPRGCQRIFRELSAIFSDRKPLYSKFVFALLSQINSTRSTSSNRPDAKNGISYIKKVCSWIERFGSDYTTSIGDYFRRAVWNQKNPNIAHEFLEKLTKEFDEKRIRNHLPFLTGFLDNFHTRFPTADLQKFLGELDGIALRAQVLLTSRDSIENTPFHYLLFLILPDGADPLNPWRKSEKGLWDRFNGRDVKIKNDRKDEAVQSKEPSPPLPPVLRVNPYCAFLIAVSDSMQMKVGKQEEVRSFIKGLLQTKGSDKPKSLQEQFLLPDAKEQIVQLGRIEKMIYGARKCPGYTQPVQILDLLAKAAKECSDDVLRAIVPLALPFLAAATETHIPYLDEEVDSLTDAQLFDLLESIRILLDDRIVVTLEAMPHDVSVREKIEIIKNASPLSQMIRYTDPKFFELRLGTETWKITAFAEKMIFYKSYDRAAETCILEKCPNDLPNPCFQPIYLFRLDTMDCIGCWYVTVGIVNGKRSLIMAGGGPRRSFLKMIDAKVFANESIKLMEKIAKENELAGGVYQAVGRPIAGKKLSDCTEGRVAQHISMKKALLDLKASDVIELEVAVPFPTDYKDGPIQYVIAVKSIPNT